MNIPVLSIITITYNAGEVLTSTLESIKKVIGSNIEFIIIDGNSSDNTTQLLFKYRKYITRLISEPDDGIFDAMNKGIKIAQGRWLIFINAGDEIRFSRDILITLQTNSNEALLYGNTERANGIISKPHNIAIIESGALPMCHQSTFYNRDILKSDLYYKTKFKLYGENELLLRLYLKGYNIKYINQTISYFMGGGVSDVVSWNTRIARYYYLWDRIGIKGVINGLALKLKTSIGLKFKSF